MVAFMGQQVNWPTPGVPVQAVKTYEISAPIQTHYRRATCEESGCLAYRHGFASVIDISTPIGQRRADYIRKRSGRVFTAEQTGSVITFTFEKGQTCFRSDDEHHVVPLDRPALFIVRDGDFRGNPTGRRYVHDRPEHWVENFAEHQQKLADAHNRG
jgi:hypothetical protein